MNAATRSTLEAEARDYRERAKELLHMAESIEAVLKKDLELNKPLTPARLISSGLDSSPMDSIHRFRRDSKVTQVDAMITALKNAGTPLTTELIFLKIKELGVPAKLPAKHLRLGAVLSRNSDIFEHIGKGLWMLRENLQSVNSQKETGAT